MNIYHTITINNFLDTKISDFKLLDAWNTYQNVQNDKPICDQDVSLEYFSNQEAEFKQMSYYAFLMHLCRSNLLIAKIAILGFSKEHFIDNQLLLSLFDSGGNRYDAYLTCNQDIDTVIWNSCSSFRQEKKIKSAGFTNIPEKDLADINTSTGQSFGEGCFVNFEFILDGFTQISIRKLRSNIKKMAIVLAQDSNVIIGHKIDRNVS